MRFSQLFSPRDWLEVRKINLFIAGLEPAFEGYRIAQFSDLHLDGRLTTPARLGELVATINAQEVDLIAFTGDFVTLGIDFSLDELIPPLRDLCARDGKVAVMGNHDHLINGGLIQRVIRDSGMINLNNACYTVQRDHACLHIAGVDSLTRHQTRLDRVLNQLPETGTAILLAHEPELADMTASTERFALQLSGHTHGGQIRIPVLTWLALPSSTWRYMGGLYAVSRMWLYVNRGIGGVGLPLRIRCRSELTIMTLHSLMPPSSLMHPHE